MSKISRRRVLQDASAFGLAAGFGFHVKRAHAAEFTYKVGNTVPATHPTNVRLTEASKKILEETGGRLEIAVYPNGTLTGNQREMVMQVRTGAAEFMITGGPAMAPKAAITGVGFSLTDSAKLWPALDGLLGDFVRKELTANGVMPLKNAWDLGLYHVASSIKPINAPEDMRGLKIRSADVPAHIDIYRALNAAPTIIAFPEVYSALQTKLIDGVAAPIVNIADSKFDEVQKYLSLTGHIWEGLWLVANPRAWEKLPADIRSVAEKHLNAGALLQRKDIASAEGPLLEKLKAKMAINKPDIAPFREAMKKAGYYEAQKAKLGDDAWDALEKVTGKLT